MDRTEVTIYHNPNCGTSRKTLALIQEAGFEPRVVEYLKTPPTRDELKALLKRANLSVRGILRQRGTPYAELGLDRPDLTEAQLLDAIEQHPVLIERPLVATPMGVRLCRPQERVLEILP
jgi:arsenate reductase